MPNATNARREFLKTALAGAAVASFASPRLFAKSKGEDLAIKPITDSVALVTGAGTNVVLVTGPEGVVHETFWMNVTHLNATDYQFL